MFWNKKTTDDSSDNPAPDDSKDIKNLPPNHLGSNVPEGFSVDFESKNKMSEQNSTVKNVSAEGADEGKFGQAGLLDTKRSPSGPSMGQLRGSRASISAPTKERVFNPHAQNPARIPTAGGVAVGSKQFQERRASRVSSDLGGGSKSPPQSPPPVAEEPAESSKDGAVNGAAGGGQPAFNFPTYDKDSVAPDSHAPEAQVPADQAGQTTVISDQSTTETEDKPSTTEKLKETVKDKLPGTTGAGTTGAGATGGDTSKSDTLSSPTSPSSPSKERRGSRFDAFKSKIGLGDKK